MMFEMSECFFFLFFRQSQYINQHFAGKRENPKKDVGVKEEL